VADAVALVDGVLGCADSATSCVGDDDGNGEDGDDDDGNDDDDDDDVEGVDGGVHAARHATQAISAINASRGLPIWPPAQDGD
jgi:hypothetical protein